MTMSMQRQFFDKYAEFDYENYLKKIFKLIFEEQLESWMADPDDWAAKR